MFFFTYEARLVCKTTTFSWPMNWISQSPQIRSTGAAGTTSTYGNGQTLERCFNSWYFLLSATALSRFVLYMHNLWVNSSIIALSVTLKCVKCVKRSRILWLSTQDSQETYPAISACKSRSPLVFLLISICPPSKHIQFIEPMAAGTCKPLRADVASASTPPPQLKCQLQCTAVAVKDLRTAPGSGACALHVSPDLRRLGFVRVLRLKLERRPGPDRIAWQLCEPETEQRQRQRQRPQQRQRDWVWARARARARVRLVENTLNDFFFVAVLQPRPAWRLCVLDDFVLLMVATCNLAFCVIARGVLAVRHRFFFSSLFIFLNTYLLGIFHLSERQGKRKCFVLAAFVLISTATPHTIFQLVSKDL